MIYYAIVHHDEGTAYGVSFPDIPNCFAAADDEADIMKNAMIALEDYFADGEEAPKPSGLSAIVKDHAADLAEGAVLISVPLIPRPMKSVRANVSFDRGLLELIDNMAARLDLSRSAFLAQAARHEVERIAAN